MKLKDYCTEKNITMKSIADALGYEYHAFSSCLRGEKRFSYERAKEISKYCGGMVTVDELLPDNTEEKKKSLRKKISVLEKKLKELR